MSKNSKVLFSLILIAAFNGSLKSEIIDITLESTAGGRFFDTSNEFGVDTVNFDDPQIAAAYGDRALGSAGTFDSVSDLDGDEILFKNGNSSFGVQASSSSRTALNIDIQNTTTEAFVPLLQSQILPAGMGFYVSDCGGENLRECGSLDDISGAFQDISTFSDEPRVMEAEFIFTVLLEGIDEPLYSLTGSLALDITNDANGTNVNIVRNLDAAAAELNGFTETTPEGSNSQVTYDWDASNFDVEFPMELAPGATARLSYIIEVNTFVTSDCISSGNAGCPIAYAAFGDPIGRGGATSRRTPTTTPDTPDTGPASALRSANPMSGAFAANFAASTDTQINGHEAGLYRLAPKFEGRTLSLMATSGPLIDVPTPATYAMFLAGAMFLFMKRKRQPALS